jgi:hypothetical protein
MRKLCGEIERHSLDKSTTYPSVVSSHCDAPILQIPYFT